MANIFNEEIEGVKALIGLIGELKTDLKGLVVETNKASKSMKFDNVKDIQKVDEAIKEVTQAEKELIKIKKQEETLDKKLISLKKKEQDQIIKTRLAIQEETKSIKDNIKAAKSLTPVYDKQRKKLAAMQKQLIELSLTEKKASKSTLKLRKDVEKLNSSISKAEQGGGQFQRQVGKYPKMFSGFTAAIGGAFLGVQGIVNAFGDAIKRTKEFEQSNANLASVLGKSSGQIKALTIDAKRLGSETSFSASQVSQLQTEFAKLGFNETEILSATEATLNLAAATGSDLGEAAAIAGATLGGFGLNADQTGRLTDVMAKSFSTSALDIEKFKESMKDAAPASKAVGVSVEKTTALLGTLANAGISGSKAGTALKSSFINLNKAGLTLEEGLDKVSNSEDKLGEAVKLVGKNAAASFLVLADGVDTTSKLEKGLLNAGGAAEKMAKTQLDTLSGSLKILDSAWEGFVLGLLEGDGVFSSLSRGVVDFGAKLLGLVTTQELNSEALMEQQVQMNLLGEQILRTNDDEEKRKQLIIDLNKEYPDLLKNVNAETLSNEELKKALAGANKEFERKIKLTAIQEELAEATKETVEAYKELRVAEEKQAEQLVFVRERFEAFLKNQKEGTANHKLYSEALKVLNDDTLGYGEVVNELNKVYKDNNRNLHQLSANNNFLASTVLTLNTIDNERNNVLGVYNEKLEKSKDIQSLVNTETAKSKELTDDDTDSIDENTGATKENNEAKDERIKKEIKLAKLRARELEISKALKKEQKKQEVVKKRDIQLLSKEEEAKQERLKKEEEEFLDEQYRIARLEKLKIDSAKKSKEIIGALSELQREAFEERQDQLDEEINASEKQQARLLALADKGSEDAINNLASEQKREAELRKQKQQEIQEQKRTELLFTALDTYSGKLAQGQTGGQALAGTITDIALLSAAIKSLPFFKDGTEDTGTASNPLDSDGGRLAVLHDNERVIDKSTNLKMKGITNGELGNLAESYKRGELVNAEQQRINVISGGGSWLSNNQVIDKLSSIEKVLSDLPQKMPDTGLTVDTLGGIMTLTKSQEGIVNKTNFKINGRKSWS